MAETRVQIAYHFKTDPTQLVPGAVRIPEQIIRTVSIGETFTTEKVSVDCLSDCDRKALIAELDKQTREATRTAKPTATEPAASEVTPAAASDEEISAF